MSVIVRRLGVAVTLCSCLSACDIEQAPIEDELRCYDEMDEMGGIVDLSDISAEYDADTNIYSDPNMWMSGPSAAEDFVLSLDLSTTIVHPDLSTTVVNPIRDPNPEFDVFFVYTTSDLNTAPGNSDLSDTSIAEAFVAEHVGRMSAISRVIVPYYRQANLGCFLAGMSAPEALDQCLETAYDDIEQAFEHYLVNDWDGRPIVLAGHSQGALLTEMLFNRVVAERPDLLERVAAVMPIGGDIEDDSLAGIGPCQGWWDTQCSIAYLSYFEGFPPQPGTIIGDWADADASCATPWDGGGARSLRMSYFYLEQPEATNALHPLPLDITTPYMAFPNYYEARCVDGDSSYLEIAPNDDVEDLRWNPINLEHPFVVSGPPFGTGTHLFDYGLAQRELMIALRLKAYLMWDPWISVIK